MCEYCKLYLVKEQTINPDYPYSREYGNFDACSFRSECGNDYNWQTGTRNFACNYLEKYSCSKCGKRIKKVLDTGLYINVIFYDLGPVSTEKLVYSPVQLFSEWLVTEPTLYIPRSENTTWIIQDETGEVLANLICTNCGFYRTKLFIEDTKVSELAFKTLQCKIAN